MFEFLRGEKPCPFCGHNKLLLVKEKDYDANIVDLSEKCKQANVWLHVVCMKCKARSREESSKERAIEVWNMRTEAQKGREDAVDTTERELWCSVYVAAIRNQDVRGGMMGPMWQLADQAVSEYHKRYGMV